MQLTNGAGQSSMDNRLQGMSSQFREIQTCIQLLIQFPYNASAKSKMQEEHENMQWNPQESVAW